MILVVASISLTEPIMLVGVQASLPPAPHTSPMRSPIQVSLSPGVAPAPAAGQSGDFRVRVTSDVATDKLVVNLDLPKTLSAPSQASLEVHDSIGKGESKTYQFSATNVASSIAGLPAKSSWTISAHAGAKLADGVYIGDVAYLYMTINGSTASYSYDPLGLTNPGYVPASAAALRPSPSSAKIPPGRLNLGNVPSFQPPSLSSGAPQSAASLTGGLACWITDNNWGNAFPTLTWGGSAGDTYNALNNRDNYMTCGGTAQLIDAVTGTVLSWVWIPAWTGRFTLTTSSCNPFNGVRIRFLPYSREVRVVRYDGTDYISQTGVFTGCPSMDTGWWTPVAVGDLVSPDFFSAYRIYDSLDTDAWYRGAWNWLLAETGFSFDLYGLEGAAQEAVYPVPSGHGTHAHFGTSQALNGAGNADGNGQISMEGRDSAATVDVPQHEWFHRVDMYVMDPVSMSWFPPGCCISHWIQTSYNPGLGLSEGIAEWAAGGRTEYWAGRPAGEYNYFSSANSYNLNMETGTWGSAGWSNGESVEGRVAGAVRDLLDPFNDGYDTISDSTANVWDMITLGNCASGSCVATTATRFTSFTQMYNTGWIGRGHNNRPIGGGLGALFQNTIDLGYMSSWSGWFTTAPGVPSNPAVGATLSNPAMVSIGSRIDLVVRGTDNKVYHAFSTTAGASWSSWTWVAGGTTNDEPALAYFANYLQLVVRGTDNYVYHTKMPLATGIWEAWTQVSGGTMLSPAALVSNYNRMELVVRGTDNHIYHVSWTSGGGWSGWDSPGGSTIDKPAAAVEGFSILICCSAYLDLHVVVRGTDNGVWYNKLQSGSGTWAGWSQVQGGYTIATPAFVNSRPGRFDLVVVGTNFGVYHSALVGGVFSPYDSPTGSVFELTVNAADGNLHVIARSGVNSIWYTTYQTTDGYWGPGWYNIPGAMYGTGTIAKTPTGIILMVRGTNNILYQNFR